MRRGSQPCVQAIMCWPSVIVKTCCAISTPARGSSAGCPVVDKACLCPIVLVPTLIATLFLFTKRLNLRSICRRLCCLLIVRRYQDFGCFLSFCVVRSVTRISPSASIIGTRTANLSFNCSSMLWEYSLESITRKCSPSHLRISQVLTSRPRSWWDFEESRLLHVLRPLVI